MNKQIQIYKDQTPTFGVMAQLLFIPPVGRVAWCPTERMMCCALCSGRPGFKFDFPINLVDTGGQVTFPLRPRICHL
jgi:hypothetical protein